MLNNLLFFIIAYFLGSFPSAYLIVRITTRGDIRDSGSGNVGALNALRVTKNKWAGVAALLLDLLKGAVLAWYIVSAYGQEYPLIWYVTAGLILGHSFPVWLKFKGGRGLAVAAGAMLFFQPVIVAIWMGIWVLFDTDATLSVTGPGLVSTMMDLTKGWNMIGYPSGTPDTVANVLAGALYTEVWGYDGVALYRLKQLAPTDMLEPGHGYWVHVTADSSYTNQIH